MRQHSLRLPRRLFRLDGIVEEKIDEDRIEPDPLARFPLRALRPLQPCNLPPHKLDAPDAAAAQLDLPNVAARDRHAPGDVRAQGRRVGEAGEVVEDLRDAVVYFLGGTIVLSVVCFSGACRL